MRISFEISRSRKKRAYEAADKGRRGKAFRLAKSAGNLRIFEHILPVKAEEWKERSFEELLKNRKAVALAELKTATAPKVR